MRFRLSDVEFLNDSSELVYAVDEVEVALRGVAEKIDPGGNLSWADTRQGLAVLFRSAAAELAARKSNFGIFVGCLSARSDSLSQWRAYGGYALGLRTSALMALSLDELSGTDEEQRIGRTADRQPPVPISLKRVEYGITSLHEHDWIRPSPR